MSDDDCVENLAKAIVNCDTSTIGNLANQCIGLIDAETIHTLTEQIKANCSDSDALATILYYLDLCKQNVSETAVIKSIAPVVPGMSCFFDPQHAFSLVALLPGEFLTGFMDGLDENITSALLKRFLDSCVNNRYLQAVIRCTVLSLTDSVIGLGRLAVHMYGEYLVRGELNEELPYWHVYVWNTLAAHMLINGILFSFLEIMKAFDPENWKQRFATQVLRMRLIPQILKLMLTYAWGGCRTKGFMSYLVNVAGQIIGHISVSRCLNDDNDDYDAKNAWGSAIKKITEEVEEIKKRLDKQEVRIDQLEEYLERLEQQQNPLQQLLSSGSGHSNNNSLSSVVINNSDPLSSTLVDRNSGVSQRRQINSMPEENRPLIVSACSNFSTKALGVENLISNLTKRLSFLEKKQKDIYNKKFKKHIGALQSPTSETYVNANVLALEIFLSHSAFLKRSINQLTEDKVYTKHIHQLQSALTLLDCIEQCFRLLKLAKTLPKRAAIDKDSISELVTAQIRKMTKDFSAHIEALRTALDTTLVKNQALTTILNNCEQYLYNRFYFAIVEKFFDRYDFAKVNEALNPADQSSVENLPEKLGRNLNGAKSQLNTLNSEVLDLNDKRLRRLATNSVNAMKDSIEQCLIAVREDIVQQAKIPKEYSSNGATTAGGSNFFPSRQPDSSNTPGCSTDSNYMNYRF